MGGRLIRCWVAGLVIGFGSTLVLAEELEVLPGGSMVWTQAGVSMEVVLDQARWPSDRVRSDAWLLATWQQVLSAGEVVVSAVDAGRVEVTVAGHSAAELLLALGAAEPVPERAGPGALHAVSLARWQYQGRFEGGPWRPTQAEDTLEWHYAHDTHSVDGITAYLPRRLEVLSTMAIDRDEANALRLTLTRADTQQSVSLLAPGEPGPLTLQIDQHRYTPAEWTGYAYPFLYVQTSQNLNCSGQGNGASLPSASIVAVVDNRVVFLDGTTDTAPSWQTAPADRVSPFVLRAHTKRPTGYELQLSSRHGDLLCGVPDLPNALFHDRFGSLSYLY